MAKLIRLNAYILDNSEKLDLDKVNNLLNDNFDKVYQLHCEDSDSFNDLSDIANENCDMAFLEKKFKRAENTDLAKNILIGGIYRHFKEGKTVKVLAVSRHSERPNEVSVVYECENGVFNRPIEMFLSDVDFEKYPNAKQKKRFELI